MEAANRVMRERWDNKARDNPAYWVAPGYGDRFQDMESCFKVGKEEGTALTHPVLEMLGFNPAGKRILDIGCGFGRLFPGFAELGFAEIWGVDISPEMVNLGEQCCPVQNAKFVLVDGGSLSGIESGYFDFCFSRGVFPHIPDERALWPYLPEIHRVLAPGGVFQLDFGGTPTIKDRALLLTPAWARPRARALYRIATLRWLSRGPNSPYSLAGRKEELDMARAVHAKRVVTPSRIVRELGKVGFYGVEVLPSTNHKKGGRFWAIGRK